MDTEALRQIREGERAVAPSVNSRPEARTRVGTRPVVLVLEDSEDDFYLLNRAFKKLDPFAEMLHLREGAQAIEHLSKAKQNPEGSPALLLLDLKMPGISGFEVLKWVRDDTVFKLLPVNILSSSSEPADIQKAFALGANAFTVKPMGLKGYDEVVATLFKFWFDLGHLPRRSF